MLKVLFTLDYEIHGNGEGSPRKLMIEPTGRLLRLFDQYGAKLTIMAEIAEILRFKEYAEEQKRDDWNYGGIVSQLQQAVTSGHDVQLHIHSSYFGATRQGRQWAQNWGEYDFAGLPPDRMNLMVKEGKEFLESTLKPVRAAYRCIAFRAGNWSISPSKNLAKALLGNGIGIDTSVFKYGRRNHAVVFDYSRAHSDLVPWRASEEDFCARDERSKLWEFPIYCENRWIGTFLTLERVLRVIQIRRQFSANELAAARAARAVVPVKTRTVSGLAHSLTGPYAWKADFNQCTGGQLIDALLRAERKASGLADDIPFVLIGHSKLVSPINLLSLRPFLKFVAQHRDRFGFETFGFFQEKIAKQNYLAAEYAVRVPAVGAAPSSQARRSYVLVTAARNEEATIETTIRSVLSQTIPPKEWVIISDRSTDQTDEIVKRFAAIHHFIRFLRIDGKPEHSFAAKILAIESGMRDLKTKDYSYVGLLDADVRFAPEYYEKLMDACELDATLGLVGGLVLDVGYSEEHPYQNLREVAGATQFFARRCFESLGGLLAIQEGGFDAVTCARARMNGFRTATLPKLVMHHLKPRNAAQGNWWRRNWHFGVRDYVLGSDPVFEIAKCGSRVLERPAVVGVIVRLAGYFHSSVSRRRRPIPENITSYMRRERFERLKNLIRWRKPGWAKNSSPNG